MFDHKNYLECNTLRTMLNASLAGDEKTLPSVWLKGLQTTEAKFALDVAKAEKLLVFNRRGDFSTVEMPTPVPFKADPDEPNITTISEYSRKIELPPPGKPYYRAVLFTEAESLVREWCEIMIDREGLR